MWLNYFLNAQVEEYHSDTFARLSYYCASDSGVLYLDLPFLSNQMQNLNVLGNFMSVVDSPLIIEGKFCFPGLCGV